MFFCSLKLDAVMCASLCRLLGVEVALFLVSVTRNIVIEHIAVFWLNDVLAFTTTQRDSSYQKI